MRDEARGIPSTLGGLVYLIVVAASAVGLLIVAFGPWRRGVGLIGLGLLFGALGRDSCSDNNAGMLRVRRSGWADVLMLGWRRHRADRARQRDPEPARIAVLGRPGILVALSSPTRPPPGLGGPAER